MSSLEPVIRRVEEQRPACAIITINGIPNEAFAPGNRHGKLPAYG